jgi:hypothetical protein
VNARDAFADYTGLIKERSIRTGKAAGAYVFLLPYAAESWIEILKYHEDYLRRSKDESARAHRSFS